MYDSLKEVVQETLQRNKTNPAMPAPVAANKASTLTDAVEELEKFIAYRIDRLKAAINDSAATVASDARHAEQAIADLKTNIATLEAKLRQSEDAIRSKDVATQKMEESLNAKVVALEAKLREAEESARGKDSIIQGLEQNVNTRIQDLEDQLRTKEKLLVARSREVIDLKAQLEHLRNGIKEMSAFFKQSQVLAALEGQDSSAVSAKGEAPTADEKPVGSQVKGQPAAATPIDPTEENASPEFFKQLTLELTQTIGPMAPMIVRDHVKALGETMEKFPKARVGELLETVSAEILDEKVKTGFRERLAQINGHRLAAP